MKQVFVSLVAVTSVLALTGSALAAAPATAITPENASRVVELRRFGEPILNSAAISPNGMLLAVATSLAVELRDATKPNTVLRTLEVDTSLQSVVFSPDGQWLVGGGKNGNVFVWQVADGRLVRKLNTDLSEVSRLYFVGDGRFLVAHSSKQGVIWDFSADKMINKLEYSNFIISPDGQKFIAATGSNSQFSLFDITGKRLNLLRDTANIKVAFSQDGKLLASVSRQGIVRLWSLESGQELRTFSQSGSTRDLKDPLNPLFSSDGRLLITAFVGEDVTIWDVETGKPIATLPRSRIRSSLTEMFLSQDNKLLIISPLIGWQLWKLPEGKKLARKVSSKSVVQMLPQRVAFSADGERVAYNFAPKRIQIRRVADNRIIDEYFNDADGYSYREGVYPPALAPIALSPRQRFLAFAGLVFDSSSMFSLVTIQNLQNGTSVQYGTADQFYSSAFSPDEKLLAIGTDSGRVYIMNTQNGTPIYQLNHSNKLVSSLAFSNNGQLLVTASLDGIICLWQVASDKLIRKLPKQEKAVLAVAFSPDDALLATAGADQTVRLWQVADGKLVQTLKGHESIVGALAFSADGALLASGALDGAINLWQVSDGKLLKTLKGHTDNIMGVAFMKNGQLASISSDGTTRLWGVK